MPVPARFQPPPIDPAELQEFCELCNEIEDRVNRLDDYDEMLERWNARAGRTFEPTEFTTYYGSMETEEFVKGALLPRPRFADDLRYEELKAVVEAFGVAGFSDEAESAWFLDWLEVNLPGSNISDLMFWPNVWFGDDSLFLDENRCFRPEAELTVDQILRFAMLKSGRLLPDAPPEAIRRNGAES